MTEYLYKIEDVQIGKVYGRAKTYKDAVLFFGVIFDAYYGGDWDRAEYLHLVDLKTNRSTSIVFAE